MVEVARTAVSAYGTAHPNTTRWPNHKLCFVETADDQGLWQRWWYCADRASQETYNGDITYPYGGGTSFPRVTRTYILPRGEQPLELGSVDPGTLYTGSNTYYRPNGTDTYYRPGAVDTYLRPTIGSGVLVFQSEKQIEGEIGSLYTEVTRIYDVIPGSDDITPGSGLSQNDDSYSIERPMGTNSFLRLTWKINLPRTIADGAIQTNFTACPIGGFENLLLVSETIKASEENNQVSEVVRVYEGNATGAAFPSTDNIHVQGKFYPGALPPAKFIVSMREVEDHYQVATPEDQDVTTPTTSTYTGLKSVEVSPDTVLRGTKKNKYYTDLVLRTLTGKSWDANLLDYVEYETEAMTLADYEDLGAAEIGTERTSTPYNSGWMVITTEMPTETVIGVIGADGTNRSYKTTTTASWPKVLRPSTTGAGLSWGNVYVRPSAGDTASSSASELFVQYEFKPQWNGLCPATVEVAWVKTAPLVNPIEALSTTGLSINWPGVANFTIDECLHEGWTFIGSTGTDHPKFGYIGYTKTWEATTYPDWPDTIIKKFTVEPYKGGFRVEKVTVSKPY